MERQNAMTIFFVGKSLGRCLPLLNKCEHLIRLSAIAQSLNYSRYLIQSREKRYKY